MADRTLLLTDDRFLDHTPGPNHPESAQRLRAIRQELEASPVQGTVWGGVRAALPEQVAAVHTAGHVEAISQLRGQNAALDPDTAVSPGSVDAAFLAAGAAIGAVDALFDGRARRSFALVRPPGHHAEADRAMGFCLFNNVAIAAEHARRARGCERVLILDWDVHHGNGTQHLFEARSDVLVLNTHRYPFYPGTGALSENGRGAGTGFTVNIPLPGGLEDRDYGAVFAELVEPIGAEYQPDLVLVSAGFDAHRDDPLADMRVTEEGFAALCGAACRIADRACDGRIALVLEGGYDLRALGRSVRACVAVLAGAEPPPLGTAARGAGALAEAVAFHRRRWPL